ncbi:MAG: hypothetical protein QOE28_2245, partial [Solirubrobacteraceae bacterium]|nr:hypothetical protein [Solirubrobacteraceae bacterium]
MTAEALPAAAAEPPSLERDTRLLSALAELTLAENGEDEASRLVVALRDAAACTRAREPGARDELAGAVR